MANVTSELDSLPERFARKSTAAIACVTDRSGMTEIIYANAGDSSIYFFNRSTDAFKRMAHTPTSRVKIRGRNYIDTAEFMGAGRTPVEIASHVGQLIVPNTSEWSLIGITDGVQDDDGQGISDALLEEIVRSTDPQDVPSTVLANIDKYDDASLFIISRLPTGPGER